MNTLFKVFSVQASAIGYLLQVGALVSQGFERGRPDARRTEQSCYHLDIDN